MRGFIVDDQFGVIQQMINCPTLGDLERHAGLCEGCHLVIPPTDFDKRGQGFKSYFENGDFFDRPELGVPDNLSFLVGEPIVISGLPLGTKVMLPDGLGVHVLTDGIFEWQVEERGQYIIEFSFENYLPREVTLEII